MAAGIPGGDPQSLGWILRGCWSTLGPLSGRRPPRRWRTRLSGAVRRLRPRSDSAPVVRHAHDGSLTIGHSYVVTENRRLAHEMGVQGRGRWEVTAIAPKRFRGDLGPLRARAARRRGAGAAHPAGAPRSQRAPHALRRISDAAMAGAWDVVHAWEEPYIAAGAQIAGRRASAARSSCSRRFRTSRRTTRGRSRGSSGSRWRAPTAGSRSASWCRRRWRPAAIRRQAVARDPAGRGCRTVPARSRRRAPQVRRGLGWEDVGAGRRIPRAVRTAEGCRAAVRGAGAAGRPLARALRRRRHAGTVPARVRSRVIRRACGSSPASRTATCRAG